MTTPCTNILFPVTVLPSCIVTTISFLTMRLATSCHQASCRCGVSHSDTVTVWGCSAIVVLWLSLDKAAIRGISAISLCQADCCRRRASLYPRGRSSASLLMTSVGSLQALEHLSSAAADAAVLLRTCIVLLVKGLEAELLLVLSHRTATTIFPHCNVATVPSQRRSPLTVISLHRLHASPSAGALSTSRPHLFAMMEFFHLFTQVMQPSFTIVFTTNRA